MILKAKENTTLSSTHWLRIDDFAYLDAASWDLSEEAERRLIDTRAFIDYLLEKKIQIYGLTTGFADLRHTSVAPESGALLSVNLIRSHDAGIGADIPFEITLGAMLVRAHALAKGYSGFSREGLDTLLQMLNHQIVPLIPCTGSLGASGDLASLARLGRAMMGDPVPVWFKGAEIEAGEALRACSIPPFAPKAKEGLALTNGTPFMASMAAIAYRRQILWMKNLVSLTGLYLNAVGALQGAFCDSLHQVRHIAGQSWMAQELLRWLVGTESQKEVQNDYTIRCLPQIYGPRFELILEQEKKIEAELNAITDNPLIFRGDEISKDVSVRFDYNGQQWAVLSGGNFHGENLTMIADLISLSNAKMALTIERQLTYLMNPFRNKGRLPTYLVAGQAGLQSGYMITQYTANALTHKICLLAHPSGAMNLTSANESEDIVSYGATACQRWLEQLELMKQLLAIYLIGVGQAYSLAPLKKRNLLAERAFSILNEKLHFPHVDEDGFEDRYKKASAILDSKVLAEAISFTLLLPQQPLMQ